MTPRLSLLSAAVLSALALSACGEPQTLDLGATNLTRRSVEAVAFSSGGEVLATVGPLEPGASTVWQQVALAPGEPVDAVARLGSGREVALPTVVVEERSGAWLHVRIRPDDVGAEAAWGETVNAALDPPYGRLDVETVPAPTAAP